MDIDGASPHWFSMSDYGSLFAPIIDLEVSWSSTLGNCWVPQGMADEDTPLGQWLGRCTMLRVVAGVNSDWDNHLEFDAGPDASLSPSGLLIVGSDDLRNPFGMMLGEVVLVRPDVALLADPHRLDLIATDIATLIATARQIALSYR